MALPTRRGYGRIAATIVGRDISWRGVAVPSRSQRQPLGPLGRTLGRGVLAMLLAMVLVALLAGSAWGGGASFGAPATYGVAQYPISVAVDDFNGDGNPDIVAAVAGIHGVDVLLGKPDGS